MTETRATQHDSLPPEALSAFARDLIARGSNSFSGASKLFGNELRDSASLLYAWCRHCDDVIDDQVLGQGVAGVSGTVDERLETLEVATQAAVRAQADEPAFEALAWVVARHKIPERYPLELLQGMAMDAQAHKYRSLDDTLLYSYHVAGVVGVMMTLMMGARDSNTLHRACDLGMAFQLTNISRDVMEDAARDRIYLPADWMREQGVPFDPQQMQLPEHRAGLYRVVLRLLDTADDYYDSARHGLQELPFRCACAIGAARLIYRDIGHTIRAGGEDILMQRAVVTHRRKLLNALFGVGTACRAHSIDRLREAPARQGLWTREGLSAG
jgi:phytoene synthase